MFFSIFINMNKSAALKLDKFIQLVLIEQVLPNYKLPSKLPAGALDVINDPNIKYADNLKHSDYASIVPLIKNNPEVVRAKTIAKTIYDAKGIVSDDMYLVVKAIKQIKDTKQFYLVQTELQKLTNGRGIGQYIVSFLGTMIGGVADLNLVETLRDGAAIVKHLTSIKADPATIKIINDRIAKAAIQQYITTKTPVALSGVGVALNAVNAVSMWTYEHDTWDTFINGANGKDDGLRGVTYTIGGIVVTTILAFIPQTKAITGAIFGLLAADDVYRISNGNNDIETWLTLIMDLVGMMMGGSSSSLKSSLRPIAKLLAAVAGGAKGKLLIPLINAVQKGLGVIRETKFGQLLKKLGEGIIPFITSLISKMVTQFISALKLVAKKYPKLMSWCNQIIKVISNIVFGLPGRLAGGLWKALKVLWQIISYPGKSASQIVQKIFAPSSVVVKGAFGTGAKVAVNVSGIVYIILPGFSKLMNPSVEDAEAKMLVAVEAAIEGAILGLPKTGNTIYCYTMDASGNLNYELSYEMFYVSVDIADSTAGSQPVPIMMHKDTKDGIWMQIDVTTDINAYNNSEYYNATYWVDSRQLIQINTVPVTKYITKNNKK